MWIPRIGWEVFLSKSWWTMRCLIPPLWFIKWHPSPRHARKLTVTNLRRNLMTRRCKTLPGGVGSWPRNCEDPKDQKKVQSNSKLLNVIIHIYERFLFVIPPEKTWTIKVFSAPAENIRVQAPKKIVACTPGWFFFTLTFKWLVQALDFALKTFAFGLFPQRPWQFLAKFIQIHPVCW